MKPNNTSETPSRAESAPAHCSTKLTYGNGNLQTQQGKLANGNPCICITKHDKARTIGYVPMEWSAVSDESDIDVILEFKSIESARTLQDELGELIAIWSREKGRTLPESNATAQATPTEK